MVTLAWLEVLVQTMFPNVIFPVISGVVISIGSLPPFLPPMISLPTASLAFAKI